MGTNNRIKVTSIFILLLFLMNIAPAMSQLRFGLKGGFDVVSNRLNKDILNAHNRLGFHVGGTVELMSPIIGLGGELSVLYGLQKGENNVHTKEASSRTYGVSDYNYLSVPLNLKKTFSILGLLGGFIQAGPYVEFKLNGGDVSAEQINEQWKAKTFAVGVNAGAGVLLLNQIELGMFYRKSLTENYGEKQGWENIVKNRPHNWSVDLTYFF